jgi:Amidase
VLFKDCDALSCVGPVFRLPMRSEEPAMIAYIAGSGTCCFNISGHPAAAVATGIDDRGMPTSMQIVGPHWDEAMVIRVTLLHGSAAERSQPGAPTVYGSRPSSSMAVQRGDGNGHLSPLPRFGPRAQRARCQPMRPRSAISCRCQSRSVGAVCAVALGTALDLGGTMTAAVSAVAQSAVAAARPFPA